VGCGDRVPVPDLAHEGVVYDVGAGGSGGTGRSVRPQWRVPHVQRVVLTGPPSRWPALPAWYPDANAEWVATHQHHADYRIAPVS